MIWHVDDLMASCKVDFKLTKFSCYLGNIHGPKLMMHMGRKHDYLGVNMEFYKDGMLEALMVQYLKNIIAEFLEAIRGKSATPAHETLFVIRDHHEAKKLVGERALDYHHMVAQLLFLATRAR